MWGSASLGMNDAHVHVAAHQACDGLRPAGARHRLHLEPAKLAKDLQTDVATAPLGGDRGGDVVFGLGPGDQLLQILVRGTRLHDQRVGVDRDPTQCVEGLEWVVRQGPLVGDGEIFAGAPADEDRVAVGLGLHHLDAAGDTTATWLVDHDEGLREVLGGHGGNGPRHHVGRAARSVGHDEIDGLVREVRRSDREGGKEQRQTHGYDETEEACKEANVH